MTAEKDPRLASMQSSLETGSLKATTPNGFPDDAIAIVGVGCRLPGANSLDELWEIISQRQSRLEKLRPERCDPKQTYRALQNPEWITKREFYGNFVDDAAAFDHAFFGISPREAADMDPQQRLLLQTAFEAMDSSGYLHDHSRAGGDPVGCFIGASYTEYLENTSARTPSAFTATGTIRAFLSGRISHHFGWTGPSEVIDTACSASLVAVHRAVRALQAGECTMALAGGVNVITGVHNYFDLARANFLSPTGQCKPFDDAADGYCRADGVCLVVLKPLRQAVLDRDNIMGVIPAAATNQGGVHAPGITVPDGTAQKALFQKLLDQSGWAPADISYIEAHGTGTRVGDPIEMSSIREVFGGPQRPSPVHVGSLKANVGHSETAAGAAGLLKVLAMMRHGGIPPLRGFCQLNRNIPPLEPDNIVIPTETMEWNAQGRRRAACISSYGASGSNSAIFCAEWRKDDNACDPKTPSPARLPASGTRYPILLSGATAESVSRQAQALAKYLMQPVDDISLGDVAYTLSRRRKHHRFRWTTVVDDMASLVEQLRSLDARTIKAHPKTKKKVVLAFSGQSGTTIHLHPNTLRDNPRLAHHLRVCNRILLGFGGPDIMSAALHQSSPISDPSILQCGLAAVQYACARCWIEGGLEVAGIVGHSLGELAALAVSGVLSLEDMLKVVYLRAELIKSRWGLEGGAMVAVHAPLDKVLAMVSDVADRGGHLEVACHNSINSHVVVGSQADVKAAIEVLEEEDRYGGIRFHRVDVTHGFHSQFTEPLLQGLSDVEKGITFRPLSIPLETSTKDPVDFGSQLAPVGYLVNHARNAVYFSDAVQRLEAKLGPCVWVEAGIGTPVVPMARRAVASSALHAFVPVAVAPEAAAADIWREGLQSTGWTFLSPLESGVRHIWLPSYSFESPKHWLHYADRAVEEHKNKEAQNNGHNQGGMGSTSPDNACKVLALVTYEGKSRDAVSDTHCFSLNTTTERYDRIVRGHSVRGLPLCPASVYTEAAVMALQQLGNSARGKLLTIRNTVFSRPLGCDPVLAVRLSLTWDHDTTEETLGTACHFAVQSATSSTAHSEGDIYVKADPVSGREDRQSTGQALRSKMERIQNDKHAESFKRATAYHLFSRVVEYSDLMRGIRAITMGSREAVASIRAPKSSFSASESTVMDFYDAITIDTFIQVLGLLVNHSTICEGGTTTTAGCQDDIYVASSIGAMELEPVDFGGDYHDWKAYATYSVVDAKTTSGDVFVMSEETGEVVFSATDVHFVKVKAATMAQLLEISNPSMAAAKTLPRSNKEVKVGMLGEENQGFAATLQVGLDKCLSTEDLASQLLSLVSAYTGVAVEDMETDETLGSMGLDSLASIELADELDVKLGLHAGAGDLNSRTLQFLLDQLRRSGGSSDASSPSSPPGSDTTPLTTSSTCGEESEDGNSLEFHQTTMATTWARPKQTLDSRFAIEEHVYKQVDGLEIVADVYVPTKTPAGPMCVALMIHGGGFLTLSRKAVRTRQTKHLLAHGLLPVSVDHRLCPQVNVIDGAMTDARDACLWAQHVLPDIMKPKGITVDRSRYVVVGWSTGGTLAMTTAWTVEQAGGSAPASILTFYCPVSYDPREPINMGAEFYPRTMSLSEIGRLLPKEPTTQHVLNMEKDTTKLGWLQAGDPRSELVLALVKEDRGMALLFNDDPLADESLPQPDEGRAAAFSPLVQLRRGRYRTPTCVVFGDRDEIAPHAKGEEFIAAAKDEGVDASFVSVGGARHIFDLDLAPGSEGWDRYIAPAYEFVLRGLEEASSGVL
ncbi:hypothetical protein PspLS_00311 [Pyricularia sp. CBS 133598]|nr:hypothetical protein PspLS_00311 [Pyricularia sp. CBS 133598]